MKAEVKAIGVSRRRGQVFSEERTRRIAMALLSAVRTDVQHSTIPGITTVCPALLVPPIFVEEGLYIIQYTVYISHG